MRGCFQGMLTMVAVAALASPAFAQGRGGFGMGGGGVGLIGNPGVQKELGLDEAQIGKAASFADDMGEKQREMRSQLEGLDGDERMKKMQELNQAATAEGMKTLGTFLKPEQTKRFGQIVLQQRGGEALTDPVIAKELKVTDEQAEKVKAVIGEQRTQMMSLRDSANNDRETMMQKGLVIRKEANTKILALMSDAQKGMWKEMTGEPFEITYAPRPAR